MTIAKIGEVVRRCPRDVVGEILVVDDGSTDATPDVAGAVGARVISLGRVAGVGAAIRQGFEIAHDEAFDIVTMIACNNKDDPNKMTRLLDPIYDNRFDFVMGSRFLAGRAYGGDMPAYQSCTRLHPFLVGLLCRRLITESTNGYRAIRTAVLADPRIDLNQCWLDHHEHNSVRSSGARGTIVCAQGLGLR